MWISPLGKALVERLKNLNDIVCVVDFGTGREPIDDTEPM
jgi:hypothetical protein